jgi:creatinine amidohydrolase/Fe(II)-dependent formamide hydrolase-like protein
MSGLAALTWDEFSGRAAGTAFWVLATGSVEQHGPHLPLGADHLIAERLADEAERLGGLRLPFTPLGVTLAFSRWPGTIGVDAETYARLLVEVGSQAGRWCPRLLVVNAHDENQAAIALAASRLVDRHGMEVVFFEWAELVLDVVRAVCESTTEMHAGEAMTSLFLHWFPDLVRAGRIADGAPAPGGMASDDVHADHLAHVPRRFDPAPGLTGVFGRPSLANAEKGARIAGALFARMALLLEERRWRGSSA